MNTIISGIMSLPFKVFLKLLGTYGIGISAAFASQPANDNAAKFFANDVITRNVCIIGGGSSGTFSAVQLRDMGKSIVVVEQNDRLGGHTNTFTDPVTNATVGFGVVFSTA